MPPDPLLLHPLLWRADGLGRAPQAVRSSGFATLYAQLFCGGWPCHALTELLLPRPGVGEIRLLAPVLAGAAQAAMLFDPPALPCAQALAQLGIDVAGLMLVRGPDPARREDGPPRRAAADALWALEQALRSGAVDVVLAWLPAWVGTEVLRRLQLAAQAHPGPAFLVRGLEARQRPSPAPLRLMLRPGGVPDEVSVQWLKRRGPKDVGPLRLVLPPVLPSAARSRLQAEAGTVPAVAPQTLESDRARSTRMVQA